MKFRRVLLMSLATAAASLAACGGGGNEEASFVQTRGLSLRAAPYLNLMPMGTAPGMLPSCVQLIVPFTVRSANGGVPTTLQTGKMIILAPASGKILWTADTYASVSSSPVTPDNITDSETVLQGNARGCQTEETTAGMEVVVMVELTLGQAQENLSVVATTYAVY